jgi:hypothetical protein
VFFFSPKFCTNVEIKTKREYFITVFFFLGGGGGGGVFILKKIKKN